VETVEADLIANGGQDDDRDVGDQRIFELPPAELQPPQCSTWARGT
jgi:hypothetical protein